MLILMTVSDFGATLRIGGVTEENCKCNPADAMVNDPAVNPLLTASYQWSLMESPSCPMSVFACL